MRARSLHEYYQVLQKLVSSINDDHTYVELPSCLNQDLDRPGISLVGIRDRFFVKRVFDRKLEEKGILAGMELVKIDGLPVIDYASENVYPYMPRLPHHSATWDWSSSTSSTNSVCTSGPSCARTASAPD
jgi:hypothetical protein